MIDQLNKPLPSIHQFKIFQTIFFFLDVVPQQFSRQNSVSKEEDEEKKKVVVVQATSDKEKVNDLPAVLPSVKELACKFLPKKSPEPMPRKSLKVMQVCSRIHTLESLVYSGYKANSIEIRMTKFSFKQYDVKNIGFKNLTYLQKIETNTVKDHQPPYPFKQLHQQPEPSREVKQILV